MTISTVIYKKNDFILLTSSNLDLGSLEI